MAVVTVFGGGQFDQDSFEYNSAVMIGKLLAERNFDIATGGYAGVMEAALNGAYNFNVRRIGITTDFYPNRIANKFVAEEIRTVDYIERLNKLIEIGDAYVVLPGETGTLLELAAVWTLKDRELLSNKPIICLGDQWNEVIQTMTFYSERLLETAELVAYAETAEDAAAYIINFFEDN